MAPAARLMTPEEESWAMIEGYRWLAQSHMGLLRSVRGSRARREWHRWHRQQRAAWEAQQRADEHDRWWAAEQARIDGLYADSARRRAAVRRSIAEREADAGERRLMRERQWLAERDAMRSAAAQRSAEAMKADIEAYRSHLGRVRQVWRSR